MDWKFWIGATLLAVTTVMVAFAVIGGLFFAHPMYG